MHVDFYMPDRINRHNKGVMLKNAVYIKPLHKKIQYSTLMSTLVRFPHSYMNYLILYNNGLMPKRNNFNHKKDTLEIEIWDVDNVTCDLDDPTISNI